MGRPKTQNAGSALERQAIRAKVKRMLPYVNDTYNPRAALEQLLVWIDKRTARDNAKPGGLGKKS